MSKNDIINKIKEIKNKVDYNKQGRKHPNKKCRMCYGRGVVNYILPLSIKGSQPCQCTFEKKYDKKDVANVIKNEPDFSKSLKEIIREKIAKLSKKNKKLSKLQKKIRNIKHRKQLKSIFNNYLNIDERIEREYKKINKNTSEIKINNIKDYIKYLKKQQNKKDNNNYHVSLQGFIQQNKENK